MDSTVFDIADLGGIERYQLRKILPQIKTLYSFLDCYTLRLIPNPAHT